MNCPAPAELERAFPAGAGDELARHIESCASCGAEWRRMDELASLVRDLPVEELSPARARDVRDGVLAGIARRRPGSATSRWSGPRTRAAALALAAGLAAAGLFYGLSRFGHVPADPARNATVVASRSARFTHQPLPDETVRLVEGTVSLDVERLSPGQRMRVVTGDAEVEVRGTSFVVEAHDDRLAWVHVLEGRVEVRASGEAPVVLGALEHWRPAVAADTVAPASATPEPARTRALAVVTRTPVPAGVRTPVSPTSVAPASPDLEAPYRAAWDAFRRGDFDAAATGFRGVTERSPEGPLAADAAYWRAVALGRAGRAADAREALAAWVQRFPDAPQAGEASAMLGWLLLDTGDLDGARSAFDRAIRSGSDAAASSAAEGLRAVDAHAFSPAR